MCIVIWSSLHIGLTLQRNRFIFHVCCGLNTGLLYVKCMFQHTGWHVFYKVLRSRHCACLKLIYCLTILGNFVFTCDGQSNSVKRSNRILYGIVNSNVINNICFIKTVKLAGMISNIVNSNVTGSEITKLKRLMNEKLLVFCAQTSRLENIRKLSCT